jgi:hypothetical protein
MIPSSLLEGKRLQRKSTSLHPYSISKKAQGKLGGRSVFMDKKRTALK